MCPDEDFPELVIHCKPVSKGQRTNQICTLCQDQVAGGISPMLWLECNFFVWGVVCLPRASSSGSMSVTSRVTTQYV